MGLAETKLGITGSVGAGRRARSGEAALGVREDEAEDLPFQVDPGHGALTSGEGIVTAVFVSYRLNDAHGELITMTRHYDLCDDMETLHLLGQTKNIAARPAW